MKKKKLKKRLNVIQHDIDALTRVIRSMGHGCNERTCENYKPKTVEFKRYVPLPEIHMMHEGYTGEIPTPKLKEETYERTTGGESGGKTD